MGSVSRSLTLIVHGTFAAKESWWKLGGNGSKTFADNLEAAMADRGMAGTVWKPALDHGSGYDKFTWGDENLDKHRAAGGRKLGESLNDLATRMGATDESPLHVNFVAHSHGGNVILEALPRLEEKIRVGRVVFLGTPLVGVTPACRFIRLCLSLLFISFAISLALFAVPFVFFQLLHFVFTLGQFWVPNDATLVSPWWVWLLVPLLLVLYSWEFWGLASIADKVWWAVIFPYRWLRRRTNGQAYGPPASSLSKILGDGKISLLTSYEDEADLILHLGTGPRQWYDESLAEKLNSWGRWRFLGVISERIFVRPIVVGLFIPVLEIILERVALGFSWLSALFFNYSMADLKEGKEYPRSVLIVEDVTGQLQRQVDHPVGGSILPNPTPGSAKTALSGTKRHAESLKESIRAVKDNVRSQVTLLHSTYYRSPMVIERVADILTDQAPMT